MLAQIMIAMASATDFQSTRVLKCSIVVLYKYRSIGDRKSYGK
jgi:hypothetical protein